MVSNIKINMKQFNKIINSPCICTSYHGKIYRLDEDRVAKIYYKDLLSDDKKTYSIAKLNKLVNAQINEDNRNRRKRLKIQSKLSAISNTKSCDLFKGIITYHGAIIGVMMKNYEEYEVLSNVIDELSKEEALIILKKVNYLLDDLASKSVYPFDIKMDSIMVRMSDLDVKLVDLDDELTQYDVNDTPIMTKLKNRSLNTKKIKIKNRLIGNYN